MQPFEQEFTPKMVYFRDDSKKKMGKYIWNAKRCKRCQTLENQNKTKSLKPKINFYRALIKRISALSEKSVIRIKTIRLNKLKSLLSADKIIGSFGYHAAISALLAYFYQKSKKLITEENALVLIPDTNESSFVDIRLSTELYNIVFALLRLFFDLSKSRRKGKI